MHSVLEDTLYDIGCHYLYSVMVTILLHLHVFSQIVL